MKRSDNFIETTVAKRVCHCIKCNDAKGIIVSGDIVVKYHCQSQPKGWSLHESCFEEGGFTVCTTTKKTDRVSKSVKPFHLEIGFADEEQKADFEIAFGLFSRRQGFLGARLVSEVYTNRHSASKAVIAALEEGLKVKVILEGSGEELIATTFEEYKKFTDNF